MKLTALKLARKNLKNHKTRYHITVIGVIISIFLLSLVFIISDSLKNMVSKEIAALPPDSIVINGSKDDSFKGLFINSSLATLSNNDANKIKELTHKGDITSQLVTKRTVSFDNQKVSDVSVVATSQKSAHKLNVQLLNGSWFDDQDNKNWVVLGEGLAHKLLNTNKSQNQVITIKGNKFVVIGIIKQTNNPVSTTGYLTDWSVFMSLSNGQRLDKSNRLSQITVSGVDSQTKLKQQINQSLSTIHTDEADFSVNATDNMTDQLNRSIDNITFVACLIAGVLLITSVISITNLMIINVIERHREIGVRKAVGATTRNILSQFMMESLVMSIRGGVIGLVLAYLIAFIGLFFVSIPVTFSWLAIVVGLVVPVVVGLVAGIYPAIKAARQDVIDNLTYLV